MKNHLFWAGVIAATTAVPALAAPTSASPADPLIETVIVTAPMGAPTAVAPAPTSSLVMPDSAALAATLPGAALVSNGGLSGQIQYRGLAGDRTLVRVDGQRFKSGSPNAMDPPMHYAPMPLLESIEVNRGVSPVRDGPGLGGGFDARLKQVGFGSGSTFAPHADITGQYDSNGGRWSGGGVAGFSNDRYRINLIGSHEQGGNSRFPGGEIRDSAYARDVYGLSTGMKSGGGAFSFEMRHQDTGATGNPVLPMDILFFHTDFVRLGYKGPLTDTLWLDAGLGYANVHHAMDNFSLRPGPASPMMDRRANAASNALTGHANFRLGSEAQHFGFGVDFEKAGRNALIVNPKNAQFYVQALPDIAMGRVGGYAEWRGRFGRVESEIGARADHHTMDAGAPRISPVLPMGAQMLAAAFTKGPRSWSGNTFDVVASFWSQMGDLTPRLTLARKTRAPNAVERYSWLPLKVSGGQADGNIYVGDTHLKPETAWIAETGFDWRHGRSFVRPVIYYRRIDDYIQGVPYDATPGTIDSTVEMVAAMNSDPTPLRFANVGAEFYGADLDFGAALSDHLSLSGTANYVRARRTDIHDNLYRIAPPHLRLGVRWIESRWSATLDAIGYAAQHDVSHTNGEQPSGGYVVANLFGQWTLKDGVRLMAGIDNLFDRNDAPHLGGFNRVTGSDVPVGARLPAPGRSSFLRVEVAF